MRRQRNSGTEWYAGVSQWVPPVVRYGSEPVFHLYRLVLTTSLELPPRTAFTQCRCAYLTDLVNMQPSLMSTTPPTARRDDELETEPGSQTMAERPDGSLALWTTSQMSPLFGKIEAGKWRPQNFGQMWVDGVIDHDENTRTNTQKLYTFWLR